MKITSGDAKKAVLKTYAKVSLPLAITGTVVFIATAGFNLRVAVSVLVLLYVAVSASRFASRRAEGLTATFHLSTLEAGEEEPITEYIALTMGILSLLLLLFVLPLASAFGYF
jgi:hypothetical protein